jgi:hypothetical protein
MTVDSYARAVDAVWQLGFDEGVSRERARVASVCKEMESMLNAHPKLVREAPSQFIVLLRKLGRIAEGA